MMKMKIASFAGLLFVALFLSSSLLQISMAAAAATTDDDALLLGVCKSKCSNRCAVAGMRDRCLTYCGICCRECKCVPSGTAGHKDECPCYRDKKNKKGGSKCP